MEEILSTWYLQIRVSLVERTPSRLLQILETQRVPVRAFRCEVDRGVLHAQVLIDAEESHAQRICLLIQRLAGIASAVWTRWDPLAAHDELGRTSLSLWTPHDVELSLDEDADFWRVAPSTLLRTDSAGKVVPGHSTEVRQRWSDQNLYLLFLCPYERMHLRPSEPKLDEPTNGLWNHDVAEVFVGRDQKDFERYCEFEVSPRAEWLDLAIRARDGAVIESRPLHSGFVVSASSDNDRRVWRGAIKIPLIALGDVSSNGRLRLNLFRSQGDRPVELAWQAPWHRSFHVPSRFGTLLLLKALEER